MPPTWPACLPACCCGNSTNSSRTAGQAVLQTILSSKQERVTTFTGALLWVLLQPDALPQTSGMELEKLSYYLFTACRRVHKHSAGEQCGSHGFM